MKNTQWVVQNPPFRIKKAYAGTVVYPPGGHLGPRIQNNLQLVLLHTGSMKIYIDDTEYSVPVGHVALLKPGHKEEFFFAKKRETWHRWIEVSVDSTSQSMLDELACLPLYIPISDNLNELTSLMLSIHRDDTKDTHAVISSLGQSAIWLYLSECRKRHIHVSHPAVLKTKDLIKEKFHEQLSLKELAHESHVTPEHLIRLFQKHEKVTPIQYLWHYRAERGLELLRNTGLQIGEIADRTGFKTSYHFARVVKRHAGWTPSEVRKQSWRANGS